MAKPIVFDLYGTSSDPINKQLLEPMCMLIRKIIYVARSRFAVIGVGIKEVPIGSSLEGTTDKPMDIAIRFNSIDPKIRYDLLNTNEDGDLSINGDNLAGSLTDLGDGTFLYELRCSEVTSISLTDLQDLLEVPENTEPLVQFVSPVTITLQLVITYIEADISAVESTRIISRSIPNAANIMAIPAAVCKDRVALDFSDKEMGQAAIKVETSENGSSEIQFAVLNTLARMASCISETVVNDPFMSTEEAEAIQERYQDIADSFNEKLGH